jgi:hypothetical protein
MLYRSKRKNWLPSASAKMRELGSDKKRRMPESSRNTTKKMLESKSNMTKKMLSVWECVLRRRIGYVSEERLKMLSISRKKRHMMTRSMTCGESSKISNVVGLLTRRPMKCAVRA